ncbi:MAG: hypothetical protein IJI53_00770 [Clostridia bacterium]|nr:hypothetical protein [Clostridia bacterium]
MLNFILIVLVLSFLFRRGGLFMGRGLFGGFPFFMGGGYRRWHRRPPMGPHGGMHMGGPHHGMGGPGMGGFGGPHGRF